MFKDYVQRKLEKLVVRYFQAHPEVKLIAVVGSVGKTTTKNIIGTILKSRYRIGGALEDNNWNTEISAPIGLLGIKYPEEIRSVKEWRKVFRAAKMRIKQPATVDVVIQELGVDSPGDMVSFGRYLKPDLAVLTAVTPEHMEYFHTMEAVAMEEIAAINMAKVGLINRDNIDSDYARYITNPTIMTYGATGVAENRIEATSFNPKEGFTGRFYGVKMPDGFDIKVQVFGEQILRAVAAGIAVALEFGVSVAEIQNALLEIRPTPGRMNLLKGLKNTTIIDDTYNSSPAAAKEALRALYSFPSSGYRIAVLGSMNELGETSAEAHREIGSLCNPNLLEWVVTVGEEANQFLAPAAKANGCQVKSFANALQAGGFVNKVIKPNSVVLFKGSQDKIFTEEALKIILFNPKDQKKLVRQTPEWLKQKSDYFTSFVNFYGDDK